MGSRLYKVACTRACIELEHVIAARDVCVASFLLELIIICNKPYMFHSLLFWMGKQLCCPQKYNHLLSTIVCLWQCGLPVVCSSLCPGLPIITVLFYSVYFAEKALLVHLVPECSQYMPQKLPVTDYPKLIHGMYYYCHNVMLKY